MYRKNIPIFLIVVLCIFLSSCSKNEGDSIVDDAYIQGMEDGYKNVFLNLWYSSSCIKSIDPGSKWETDHFYLTIDSGSDDFGNTVNIDFQSLDYTVYECFEDERVLINIYSYNGNDFEAIIYDDLFYMNALLQHCEDHSAKATLHTFDNTKCLAIIVVADGIVYKAVFDTN